MAEPLVAGLIGLGVVIAVWLAIGVGLGLDWPLHVSDGADGRPSTSKFQFFVWTTVILWSYSSVAAARLVAGASPGGIGMPTNLLILMGLGAGTALGAKLATVSHGGRPKLADPGARTYRSLVADDDGNAALEKVQVLAWTFVAVGVYVASVWQDLGASSAPMSLPNVDDALLVLLGIGQAAYVGVKALPRPAERHVRAAPPGATSGSAAPAPPPVPTPAVPTAEGASPAAPSRLALSLSGRRRCARCLSPSPPVRCLDA